jgi:hypothetical protein
MVDFVGKTRWREEEKEVRRNKRKGKMGQLDGRFLLANEYYQSGNWSRIKRFSPRE